MARETRRRKTRRTQLESEPAAPALRASRRFFRPARSSKATRAARALQNAFQVGSELYADKQFRDNAEGQRQAVLEAGAGEDRDPDNEQAGYIRAWDQLDAEHDFNLISKELPELLRGFNAEDRSEEEVQQFVSDYFKEQFGGIESLEDSAYAEALAPRLLELETEIIASHRDAQLEKIQQDQRQKIYSTTQEQLANDGELDYDKLFERTGTFFEGSNRKVVFWETVYDLAEKAGDPDIIQNMPANINGVATGINDPKMLDQHNQAIAAAERKAASMAEARQEAAKEASEDRILDLQTRVAEKILAGEDPSEEVRLLKDEPEASFSDITSAVNFGQGQQSHTADVDFKSDLWAGIYEGSASAADVMEAYSNGFFGSGEQAGDTVKQMLSTVRQMRTSRDSLHSQEATIWRSSVNRRYNPRLGGPLSAADPLMHHINVSANNMYNELVEGGTDPAEAHEQVVERFDARVDNLPQVDAKRLSERRSQNTFESESLVTTESLKRVATGEEDFKSVFGGVSPGVINDRVIEDLADNKLTEDDAYQLLQHID